MTRLFLKSASNGLHPHQYDVSSVTSLDFGDLLPVMSVPCVPTDHFKEFVGKGLVRLQAQTFPSFGKAFVKSAGFYVPEHQIFEDSDAFHEKMKLYKGKAVVRPFFSSLTLVDLLKTQSTLVTSVTDPTSSSAPSEDTYDFCVVPAGSSIVYEYYKLNRLGERLYKVFKLLGYDFPSFPYIASATTASYVRTFATFDMNAVPFLSHVKVFTDMFLSGSKYNYSVQVALLHAIRNKETYIESGVTFYDAFTGEISVQGLSRLVFCLVPHESSIYTQAWNELNSPDGSNTGQLLFSEMPSGLVSPTMGTVPTSTTDTVSSNSSRNLLTQSGGGYIGGISAAGLRFLKAFDDFVRRWNLAGTKAVQKVYAQFGIKSDDFNSHFVHKLYEGSSTIKFFPVLSNSDTQNGNVGKRIGDYAGYGESGLDIKFDYKSSDYGTIIVVSWLQIIPMMLRGCDPEILKKFPEDFFMAEFDGKASRAIPYCEISVNKKCTDDVANIGQSDKAVYGYTNVYDEYRHLRDRIAGAFVTDAVAKNFLLSRDFSVIREANTVLKPQTDTVHYWDLQDNRDVTNIFQNGWSNGDRFFLYLDWSIKADRPILSDSESFDLGTGDIQIEKNGDLMS